MPLLDQYGNTVDARTPVERTAERERAAPVPANPIAEAAQRQINPARVGKGAKGQSVGMGRGRSRFRH